MAFPDSPKALGIRAVAPSHPQPPASPTAQEGPDPRDAQIAQLTAQVAQLTAQAGQLNNANNRLRAQRDQVRQLIETLRAKAAEE